METCSLRDSPQQFRTFDIRRNADNTVSILITNVDPAVQPGLAGIQVARLRDRGIPDLRRHSGIIADTTSHSYNAELSSAANAGHAVDHRHCRRGL